MEAELDDMAGQLSLLEGAKLAVDLAMETLRKEARKELAQKDEEIADIRTSLLKKLKSAEAALEQEWADRSTLIREKHDLAHRISELEESERNHRADGEEMIMKLKRDLRKTKALLRDAQITMDRAKEEAPFRDAIKALKNQLEDSQMAREAAMKAKQYLMAELNEANMQIEQLTDARKDAERKATAASRGYEELRSQLDDTEEELAEVTKKYQARLNAEDTRLKEAEAAYQEIESERDSLRSEMVTLTARLEQLTHVEPTIDPSSRRLEIALQDTKSRLDLEENLRKRLETQVSRLKEKAARLEEECNKTRAEVTARVEIERKLGGSLHLVKDELALLKTREDEFKRVKKDLEIQLEASAKENLAARAELRVANQRVQDMQAALNAGVNTDSDPSSEEDD